MSQDHLHFSTYWHPDPKWEIWAPRGIKLWAQILRGLADQNCRVKDFYTWFGKISQSKALGIHPDEIPRLNNLVRRQNRTGETHLYMWTYEHPNVPASLHVGNVIEVSGFRKHFLDDDRHVPVQFYRNMRKLNEKYREEILFPFWFKLTDIRNIEEASGYHETLNWCEPEGLFLRTKAKAHTLSPRKLTETDPREWFSQEELDQTEWRGWWEQTLLSDDWDPGQFNSERLQSIYFDALGFSQVNVPILILGERGVGKTFLAWWIRMQSPFKGGKYKETVVENFSNGKRTTGTHYRNIGKSRSNWPEVACGAFSDENSLRSELYGHVKGAFTGAVSERKGLLRLLNNDTLFLDEIGDMPRQVQRSLIKVIEDKKFSAFGSDELMETNFRLIAATNQDWPILRSKLHPDFLDRIKTVVLQLPPLREMREDIPWLFSAVYHQALREMDLSKPQRPLTSELRQEVIYHLQKRHYSLPGNIRDLKRVAIHLIGVLNHPAESQPSVDQLMSKALSFSGEVGRSLYRPSEASREIAKAFAEERGLDDVLSRRAPLNLDRFEKEMRCYMATECIRLKEERRLNWPDVLEHPQSRTIKNWSESCAQSADSETPE
jgi:DNA-binding NtrC family response regulator